MNCPKCQTAAAAGALFCPRCGAPLPKGSPAEPDSIGNLPTFHDGPEPLSIGEAPTLRQPRARRVKPGDLFLRRYRVLSELGQGGMGVVYRCQDEVGGIEVALKALPPELSQNSGEMEEVRENFRIVEKLYHPGIAAVKTLEKDAHTGDYYLILELAQGVDLRRWRKQQGGKLSLAQAIPLLRQVALALDFAHSRKIIHRDIKPGNVMVALDGTDPSAIPAEAIPGVAQHLAEELNQYADAMDNLARAEVGTLPADAPRDIIVERMIVGTVLVERLLVFADANRVVDQDGAVAYANPTFCNPQPNAGTDKDTRHNGGSNIAYADGHVKWANASSICNGQAYTRDPNAQ